MTPEAFAGRVSRGGSFFDAALYARSASRNPWTPDYRVGPLGLRPAQGITP